MPLQTPSQQNTPPRAFSAIERLHGNGSHQIIRKSTLLIAGIGGVGSWAAEALVRHGIGQIILVDLDNVAESNINRQLQALPSTMGMAKVDALGERLASINPECAIQRIEDFMTPDNAAGLLACRPDAVLDCTDQTSAKVAMAEHCHLLQLPLFMAGAAGGRSDPTCVRHSDLGATQGDALLARVRSLLRRNGRMSLARKDRFGIRAVYSTEPMRRPQEGSCSTSDGQAPQGLNCAGYGSSVCVTGTFGFALAACAIDHLLARGTARDTQTR
ncbi:tRNA threonylcarbamoyladenosine dehydratase [Methyloversatilis thermotolerans]|uniref:tRNA threonylcarbamoyladenosine dehydratase n=1 Tax=Methyloversatilis thermotolerans TaxID=1346290 RepID=UPI000476F5C1|nr:tRNA threonylcarbamoyladenosine dehydratase [Methyloversatilis thermotolerans]